jgi:putative inorganic carbon (HCO3(-)) transporter
VLKNRSQTSNASTLVVLAALGAALLLGLIIPLLTGAMAERPSRLMALPAVLVLGLMVLFNRRLLLFAIILLRASGDIVLESTRFSLGGFSTGIGGLINAGVILIAVGLVIGKPKTMPRAAVLAWAGFLALGAFAVVLSPVRADGIRTYLDLCSYFAMFTIAFHLVRTPEDFRFCLLLILFSSIGPVLYSAVDFARNHGGGFRLMSTFSHPNVMAFYLMVIIAVALYILKCAAYALTAPRRVMLNLYILLLLLLLLLTQTRSAWIGCFLFFAIYAVFFERKYLFYLLLLPLVVLFVPAVQDRLADLATGNDAANYAKLNSFAWRVMLWKFALGSMSTANYLVGNGWNAFNHNSQAFFPMAGKMEWYAHNVYVQLMYEMGMLGIAAYLFLYARIAAILRHLWKFDRLAAVVVLSLMAEYIAVSASDNVLAYLSVNWYFWLVLGAACSMVMKHPQYLQAGAEKEARTRRATT